MRTSQGRRSVGGARTAVSVNYTGTWDKTVSEVGFVLWSSRRNIIYRKIFARIVVSKIS